MDNISAGIPQLCFNINNVHVAGLVYAGVGTGLGAVFASGLHDADPVGTTQLLHNHLTSVGTGVLTNNFAPHFA